MTIPMLSGWGDDINKLANGVNDLINPNHQAQNALKQAALANPELIPQLAELEKSNPGTLDKMGLGGGAFLHMFGKGDGFINQIASTPESSKMKEDSAQRTANARRTNAESESLSANTNRTKLLTPSEVTTSNANANIASGTVQPQIDTITSQASIAKNKAKELQNQMDTIELGLKKYPDLASVNLREAAAKTFLNQPIDARLAARIQGDPVLKDQFDSYTKTMAEQLRSTTELDSARLRTASKTEQALAFQVVDKQLKDAQQRLNIYQTALKSAPTTADVAISQGNDQLAQQAKDKIRNYGEAHTMLKQTKDDVDRYQRTANSLSDILTDKALNNNTTNKDKPISNNTTNINKSKSPMVQQAIDALKTPGTSIEKLKNTPSWKKLTIDEQREVISAISGT